MDIEQKYVVTEDGDYAIFSKATAHADIAKVLSGKPVGAGFCTIQQKAFSEDVDVHCYGESLSLHISSRGEEDKETINRAINSNL